MRRRGAAAIAILAIAASCTGRPRRGRPAPCPRMGPGARRRRPAARPDGRRQHRDHRPGRGAVRSLTATGGIEIEVRHPIWSPDGAPWRGFEQGDEGPASRIVTSDPTGRGRTEFPVDTATFFLQWDPTSSRIAYLGNFGGSIGMGVAQRDDLAGADDRPRSAVLPLVVPEGERLLMHTWGPTRSARSTSKATSRRSATGPRSSRRPCGSPTDGWSTRRGSTAGRCSWSAATVRRGSC